MLCSEHTYVTESSTVLCCEHTYVTEGRVVLVARELPQCGERLVC